ncbi:DUF3558 domain-containing protein [Actinopolyspora mzabensis]|nr:DUF3558 domain-containing protein [Actinopolyspora mzabensis]
MRRSGVIAGGVLLSVVLAGCSSGSAEQNGDSAGTTTGESTSSSESSSGSAIANPKDATAVGVCELLPKEAAVQLGVQPQGEKEEVESGSAPACVWESAEDFTSVSLSPVQGRSLDTYYEHESEYVDFERITVHGHPGVRSNRVKPMESGSCGMHVAVQEDQLVQSFTTVPSDDTGSADPCALAKKALRLSLPSWPAAE